MTKQGIAALTMMSLVAGNAAAAPLIEDAVGLRITERALRFAEGETLNRPINITKPNIAKPNVKCFDEVGINAFTLDSVLQSTELDFHPTPEGLQLVANIDFIDIYGVLYGEDSDTFDLCPSFDVELQEMWIEGITFTADVRPYTDENYNLFVAFNAPPQLSWIDFHADVQYIPDFLEDLVFSAEFVQDFLMRKVNEALAEKVPAMFSEALFAATFTGEAGPFDYAIGVASIGIDEGGANTFLDIQVDAAQESPACVAQLAQPTFVTRGTPGLGEYGDLSMLELSVSDAGVNEVLWAAWKSGFMCYDSETRPLEPFKHVLEGIMPGADDLMTYEMSIGRPPEVLFEDGKLSAKMIGFHMQATALNSDGEEKLLMRVDADMSMGVQLEVEKATNRVLVTLDAMDLEFDRIESEILFSESGDAEEDLKEFIKGFVIPRMQNKLQRHEITNSVFPVSNYVVLLDSLNFREGHVVAGASMLRSDDPSINHNAPDTFVDSNPGLVKRTHTAVSFSGTDDDTDSLVYSWQIDGAGWSAWREEDTAELTALTEGEHVFEVKARDRWQNEDPTPASVTFTVAAISEREMMGGCGCNLSNASGQPVSGGAAGALFAAVAVGLAIVQRRRHAA